MKSEYLENQNQVLDGRHLLRYFRLTAQGTLPQRKVDHPRTGAEKAFNQRESLNEFRSNGTVFNLSLGLRLRHSYRLLKGRTKFPSIQRRPAIVNPF